MMIRQARVADAAAIVELDRALAEAGVGMVLTPDQIRTVAEEAARIDDIYRGMRAGDATTCVVAEIDGAVVGAADLRQLYPMRVRHVGVLSVGVRSSHRRRGVARALMQHLIEHARSYELTRLELYVREDNQPARSLYASLGFRHEGTRVRFVRLDDGGYADDCIYTMILS
jgi:ribosomal protein S18 acetylase RimI-like enzyme